MSILSRNLRAKVQISPKEFTGENFPFWPEQIWTGGENGLFGAICLWPSAENEEITAIGENSGFNHTLYRRIGTAYVFGFCFFTRNRLGKGDRKIEAWTKLGTHDHLEIRIANLLSHTFRSNEFALFLFHIHIPWKRRIRTNCGDLQERTDLALLTMFCSRFKTRNGLRTWVPWTESYALFCQPGSTGTLCHCPRAFYPVARWPNLFTPLTPGNDRRKMTRQERKTIKGPLPRTLRLWKKDKFVWSKSLVNTTCF